MHTDMNFTFSILRAPARRLAVGLLAAASLVACHNDEELTIPVTPSYSDPNENLIAFKQQLEAAPQGWEATLRPQTGKVYTLFMTLGGGEVTLYADTDTTAAQTPSRTPYAVELTQTVNPSLVFADGSNLARVPGGGTNPGVDKAYSYTFMRGDTLYLRGNQYGDELRLVKASAETRAAYEGRALRNAMKAVSGYLATVHYLYLQPSPDLLIQFAVNPTTRGLYITYLNDGVKFFGSDYAYAPEGMRLKSPLHVAGNTLQEITWHADSKQLSVVYNGVEQNLQKANIPVIPLHYLLGTEYPPGAAFPSPEVRSLPGWSSKFRALWMKDDGGALEHDYSLIYVVPDIHIENNTMELYVYYVNPEGGYLYGKMQYAYTKTADGVFDFTFTGIRDDEDGDAARAIQPYIPTILGVLENNRFRIEFFDATAYVELGGAIPQFISVDDPELYFTGLWFTR
jgi:hypothetical protein